jgi:hypothetical protein
MRKWILGGLVAASMTVPAASRAMPNRNDVDPSSEHTRAAPMIRSTRVLTGGGSNLTHGGGMVGGNEPGHVMPPSTAPIDPESRGPINDVQPGRGTDDTLQSTNPPPANPPR